MTITEIRSLERRVVWLKDHAEIIREFMISAEAGSRDQRECYAVWDIAATRAQEALQSLRTAKLQKNRLR